MRRLQFVLPLTALLTSAGAFAQAAPPAADVQILFDTGDRVREIDLQDCLKTGRGRLVMEALSLPQ